MVGENNNTKNSSSVRFIKHAGFKLPT